MTNLAQLKAIYTALGGSSDTVAAMTTSAEVLAKVAEIIPTAIAKELPTVTSSNNGQVLTVVSGKWKNADLPS